MVNLACEPSAGTPVNRFLSASAACSNPVIPVIGRNRKPPLIQRPTSLAACSIRRSASGLGLAATVLLAVVLILAALSPAAHAAPTRSPALTITMRTVTPPGGKLVRINVESMGDGEPVLFLHGLGGSTYTWRKVAPALARTNRVIALDLKGFGRSEKPLDEDYALADHAAIVAAYIEAEGLKNVTLAGHSFGGLVALAVALDLGRRNPLSIRRLVLIDAPAYPQGDTPLMQIVQQPLLPYALLSVLSPEFSTSLALQKQIDARTIDEADIRAYAAPYHDPAARHALISTARQMLPLNWPEVVAAYRTLRQPTLLVWCDRDEVVPAVTGLRLERAIPNANLKIIEGCEHSPPDEAAPELVTHMQRFLAPPQHSALARK